MKAAGAALMLLAGVSYAMWFRSDGAVTVYSRDGTAASRGAPSVEPAFADGQMTGAYTADGRITESDTADGTIAGDEPAPEDGVQGIDDLPTDPFADVFFEEKPVDINKAGIDELKTLPGIGDSKAAAIVAFREANGDFSCIEDIMLVPGIKEGVFGRIRDRICAGDTAAGNSVE